MIDTPECFGFMPEGCDVPHWIPFMRADALGLDRPKFMYDTAREIVVSFPTSSVPALDEAA